MLALSGGIIARSGKAMIWHHMQSKRLLRRLCVHTSRLVAPENLFSTLQQPALSAQPCCLALVIPHSRCILALDAVIPDHPGVLSDILALDL
jgi:hypothetical protein